LTGSQYGNDKAWQDVKDMMGDERKIERIVWEKSSLQDFMCVYER